MLADAKQLAATGDELFNPALGQLIALWGFHTDTFTPHRPDPARLAALVATRPQMADLSISGNTVTSRNPAVQLDLGGYGKGYALDRAAAILKARGVNNALINIGGNVLALGSKGEAPWRVGIQHPRNRAPGQPAAARRRGDRHLGRLPALLRDGRRALLPPPRPAQRPPARGTQAVTVLITPRPGAGTLSDAASKPATWAAKPGATTPAASASTTPCGWMPTAASRSPAPSTTACSTAKEWARPAC
jgi:thiamine biosynthesis lipoprotein